MTKENRPEILDLVPEMAKGTTKFQSNLVDNEGNNPEIELDLNEKGEPAMIAFFDIDKTFTHLEFIYKRAIPQLFPEEPDIEALWKVYEGGFKLGTTWRELIRMIGIYKGISGVKHPEWIDAAVYEEEFMKKHLTEIDNPPEDSDTGEPSLYTIANDMMNRFDDIAARATEEARDEEFDDTKIKEIYELAEIYKRLKIPMFGMSANPRKFIRAACKKLGLSKYFLDCASDSDIPGAKENKMLFLMDVATKMGIKIPTEKMEVVVVGDSISGDLGSTIRFKKTVDEHYANNYRQVETKPGLVESIPAPEIIARGILVAEGEKDLRAALDKINNSAELKEMVEHFDISAVNISKVDRSFIHAKIGKTEKDQ